MKVFFTFAIFLISSCANISPSNFHQRNTASISDRPGLAEDQDEFERGAKQKGPSTDPLFAFVGVYNNGEYSPLLDLIAAAKTSIDIEIYEMGDPDVLDALRSAIRERRVRVRVVKDPNPVNTDCDLFGLGIKMPPPKEKMPNLRCENQKKFLQEVRASPGGVFLPFVKSELCGQQKGQGDGTCYEHGKTVVVDQKVALVSTGNFNSSNLCNLQQDPKTCNRDYTYVTRDPDVVKAITEIIELDMSQKNYDLKSYLDKNSHLKPKLTVSPFSLDPLVNFVLRARTSLKAQNQYMKHKKWNDALKEAAKKGVQVELMLTSACAFGPPNEKTKAELTALYQDLENAGIKLRFFTNRMQIQSRKGYLHAKVMVADGKLAWLGSVNGSTNALERNREYGLFFSQPKRVKELETVLDQDFQAEQSETWQESLRCAKDDLTDSLGH